MAKKSKAKIKAALKKSASRECVSASRLDDPLTPAERKELERLEREGLKAIQPHLDAIRRSEMLTAEDYAVTINCRG